MLFAKEVGAGSNAVSEIVNASVKRGIFSEELFNRYGILTSTGIQNRYFEITSRRAKVNVDERYLLVSAPQNAVCVTETGVYVYKNKGLCMHKSHKVKESKVKESKENKNSCNDDAVAEILWQYENLTGKTVTGSMASDVESFIADGMEKNLILAVIDYAIDSDIRKWNYIRATLNNLSAEGVTTMAEYKKMMRNNMDGQKADEPLTTISCSGAHHAEVQAFLIKYFQNGAAKSVDEPLDTITTKDRFAVITIHGEEEQVYGKEGNMFDPQGGATRAKAATILMRAGIGE